MRKVIPAILLILAGLDCAVGASSLNLSKYTLAGSYNLPAAVSEASGITYNWDHDSFVVIDDAGTNLIEISRTGVLLHEVHLTGHPVQGDVNTSDTESVTYLGNNSYAIGLERNRNVYVFSTPFSAAVSTVNLATQGKRIELFGPNDDVGNSGLEGLSYDPLTNSFLGLKEKSSSEFYRFTYNPATLVPTLTEPFSNSKITSWNLEDLADVQALATLPGAAGTGLADNALILSQQSARLVEIDGNGSILGQLSLAGISDGWNDEGVTIDFAGRIYIVGESADKSAPARMYVFAPPAAVPEPATLGMVLLAIGLGSTAASRRWGQAAKSPRLADRSRPPRLVVGPFSFRLRRSKGKIIVAPRCF